MVSGRFVLSFKVRFGRPSSKEVRRNNVKINTWKCTDYRPQTLVMNYKFIAKRSRKIPKYYSVKFGALFKSFLLIIVIQKKIMMIIFKN